MKYKQSVHWHEGLFLQSHHLQLMQENLLNQNRLDRHFYSYYPFGLVDIEFAENTLENFIIQINSIAAIMPSGVEVNTPGNTEIPALNIKHLLEERREIITIFLAVPVWTKNEANTVEMSDENSYKKCLYKLSEKEVFDENTGDNTQTVLMRKVNAKLLTDSDDFTDFEVIPILKIKPMSEDFVETQLSIHTNYIPPCMCISGSADLTSMFKDFLEQLIAFREEIVVSLNRTGYNVELLNGLVLEKILHLKAVNVSCARLSSLINKPSTAPYLLYLELRSLLSELAALQPIRDLYAVPEYEHEDCHPIFIEILSKIRNLISIDSNGSYIKIKFEKSEDGKYLHADLTDEHVVKAEDYFLAVQSKSNMQNMISIIEAGDQFKLTAESTVGGRVRGVKLKEERYPPPVLPAMHDVVWFRLKRSESQQSWNRIRNEKKIAITKTEGKLPPLEVSLYITIFEKKDNA